MIKVSVIVTTKNEEKNIENFLASVKEQNYKNIEIIVVDNNSTDKTKELSKKYTEHVYNYGPERSAQRNYGVNKSTGDYVLILDADMQLTPNVIQECVDTVEKDNSIKSIVIPEKSIGTNFWAKCKAFERNFYFIDGDPSIEAARFFDKKVYLEFGGYDESITGPEDWDLPERIQKKYKNKYRTKSYLIHNEGNVSIIKLMKKKHYYAKLAHVYMKKGNVSTVSAKTVYFLRPVFYKYWQLWFKNPVIGLGTIIMLTLELFAGGVGFLQGKLKI